MYHPILLLNLLTCQPRLRLIRAVASSWQLFTFDFWEDTVRWDHTKLQQARKDSTVESANAVGQDDQYDVDQDDSDGD